MKGLLVLALVVVAVFAAPIPTQPDGYKYGVTTNKVVRLDVYEDLLCSDCKAFEPAFKKYLNTATVNGRPVTDFVETVVHIFPLPYHHHAFFVAEMVPFVYSLNQDVNQVFQFSDWIYSVQNNYLSGAVNLSETQVKDKLCRESSQALSFISYDACLKEFSSHAHDWDARVSWKFAAYNAVSGTPTVFLNGVEVDAPNTVGQWQDLLSPYLENAAVVRNTLKDAFI